MNLRKMKMYCEGCKEKEVFRYIGKQKDMELYICEKCHTTRAVKSSRLEKWQMIGLFLLIFISLIGLVYATAITLTGLTQAEKNILAGKGIVSEKEICRDVQINIDGTVKRECKIYYLIISECRDIGNNICVSNFYIKDGINKDIRINMTELSKLEIETRLGAEAEKILKNIALVLEKRKNRGNIMTDEIEVKLE